MSFVAAELKQTFRSLFLPVQKRGCAGRSLVGFNQNLLKKVCEAQSVVATKRNSAN